MTLSRCHLSSLITRISQRRQLEGESIQQWQRDWCPSFWNICRPPSWRLMSFSAKFITFYGVDKLAWRLGGFRELLWPGNSLPIRLLYIHAENWE